MNPSDLPSAMAAIRVLNYRGLSITIPHKVSALKLVNEVDGTAQRIGCINTVVNTGGVLKGYNSDGLGALFALRSAQVEPRGADVVILGSGGAARAIAVTLAAEAPPRRLTLLGIDELELLALAETVREQQSTEVVAEKFEPLALAQALGKAQLLLHTTPVGMAPNTRNRSCPLTACMPDSPSLTPFTRRDVPACCATQVNAAAGSSRGSRCSSGRHWCSLSCGQASRRREKPCVRSLNRGWPSGEHRADWVPRYGQKYGGETIEHSA